MVRTTPNTHLLDAFVPTIFDMQKRKNRLQLLQDRLYAKTQKQLPVVGVWRVLPKRKNAKTQKQIAVVRACLGGVCKLFLRFCVFAFQPVRASPDSFLCFCVFALEPNRYGCGA